MITFDILVKIQYINVNWGIPCQVNKAFHHYKTICLKVDVWHASN